MQADLVVGTLCTLAGHAGLVAVNQVAHTKARVLPCLRPVVPLTPSSGPRVPLGVCSVIAHADVSAARARPVLRSLSRPPRPL